MKNKSGKIILLQEINKFIKKVFKKEGFALILSKIKDIKLPNELENLKDKWSSSKNNYKFNCNRNKRKGHKKESKFVIYFNIVTILIVVILFSPNPVINAETNLIRMEQGKYENMIGFNMPYLNGSNGKSGIIQNLLGFMGIDLNNPLSIMAKEVSCFSEGAKTALNDSCDEHDRQLSEEDLQGITSFNLSEEDIVKIENVDTDIDIKIKAALEKNLKDKDKPRVLIYHTHTHEGYLPDKPYADSLENSVVAVADVLTSTLTEKYGVKVVHDKTVNDLDYNASYYRSSEVITDQLNKYKDYDLIIDLHRDSSPNKKELVCNINGENTARYMFVTDDTSPNHPEHMNILNKLIDTSESIYPGFIRSNKIYHYKTGGILHFSQDKSPKLAVLEVGSMVNDISETKNTGKYLATVIAKYIADINE